ncbi:MAG: tetratricopeptide repeat protein [Sandaracinaceae bacterium]|nr:tetratricopeptide repeat protein [Sandaracinaceae bacterium]
MLPRLAVLAVCLALTAPMLLPSRVHAQASLSDPDLTRRREARMERELARGRAQAAAGHTALAQRHFEDAMRANPSAPQPYLELGRTFLALGRPTDAITILEAMGE